MDYNIEKLKSIAIEAGSIIMSYYKKDKNFTLKKDNSFLTKADIESNNFITRSLKELDSSITIISEEIQNNSLEITDDMFWLIDPLDGTKGYLNQNDQFTINIALIYRKKPILGIIYIPVSKTLFYTLGHKSYKQELDDIVQIHASNNKINQIVASSLYNSCDLTKSFIDNLVPKNVISISSAIKFCLVAEGKVDIYPRFQRTMEWDSAAGHAILDAAGGQVLDLYGNELLYGKELFENQGFIAYGYCQNK